MMEDVEARNNGLKHEDTRNYVKQKLTHSTSGAAIRTQLETGSVQMALHAKLQVKTLSQPTNRHKRLHAGLIAIFVFAHWRPVQARGVVALYHSKLQQMTQTEEGESNNIPRPHVQLLPGQLGTRHSRQLQRCALALVQPVEERLRRWRNPTFSSAASGKDQRLPHKRAARLVLARPDEEGAASS